MCARGHRLWFTYIKVQTILFNIGISGHTTATSSMSSMYIAQYATTTDACIRVILEVSQVK
jgi:hypothetical protein